MQHENLHDTHYLFFIERDIRFVIVYHDLEPNVVDINGLQAPHMFSVETDKLYCIFKASYYIALRNIVENDVMQHTHMLLKEMIEIVVETLILYDVGTFTARICLRIT